LGNKDICSQSILVGNTHSHQTTTPHSLIPLPGGTDAAVSKALELKISMDADFKRNLTQR